MSPNLILRIFTERFSDHFKPYKRRTNRLEEKTRQLGLLSGGKPAERICELMSIPISDTTILRLVKKSALPASETVTAVGVDDWAFKKRDSYGTILVDLATGKAIDLLPDREEATLTEWLEQRPEIKLLTRDRFGNFQRAMTAGAPQATQVADRWHLLKNLSETIQMILTQQYSKVNAALADKQSEQNSHSSSAEQQTRPQQNNDPKNTKLGIRQQRFSQLKELQEKGYSIRAMARHLGIHRQTIKRYLNMDTLPRKSQGNRHALEPFFPYITARMKQ